MANQAVFCINILTSHTPDPDLDLQQFIRLESSRT